VLVSVGFWWCFALVRLGVGVGASVSSLLVGIWVFSLAGFPTALAGHWWFCVVSHFGVAFSLFVLLLWFPFSGVFILDWLLGICPRSLSLWWISVASFDGSIDVYVQFFFIYYIYILPFKKN